MWLRVGVASVPSCQLLAFCEASQDKFVLLRNEAWQLYDEQIHGQIGFGRLLATVFLIFSALLSVRCFWKPKVASGLLPFCPFFSDL